MVTMSEKIRKTLYLPGWIAQLLDNEGNRTDGPGFIAAAALFNFCNSTNKGKKEILNRYKTAEIERDYSEDNTESKKEPENIDKKSLTTVREVLRQLVMKERQIKEQQALGSTVKLLSNEEQSVLDELKKLDGIKLDPSTQKKKPI